MGIDIQRVDHVGIRVRQKERALAFYEGLGFAVVSATGFERGHPAILRHASGVVLNLLGPADDQPDGNVLMDGDAKPAGITHVALRVTSLEATKAELERTGVPLTGAFSFGGLRAVFIRDPDGNVIELDERTGEHDGERRELVGASLGRPRGRSVRER